MKNAKAGRVRELADAAAWLYQKDGDPGCRKLDPRDDIWEVVWYDMWNEGRGQ